MTREEAIYRLKNTAWLGTDKDREETVQAVDMAIEALQAEPVNMLNQIPEACKNCPNHPSNGGSGICHCTLGSMTIT